MKVSEHAFTPPPTALCWRKSPLAYWVGRGWAPVSLHIGEREKLCLCWGLENKFPYCA